MGILELAFHIRTADLFVYCPVPSPLLTPAPAVSDTRRAARPRVDVPAARPTVPPNPSPSNDTVQSHPPPTVNDEHRRPQPLAHLPRRTPRPHPSESFTSRDAGATSPHFSTPGAIIVAPMRLSPTRASSVSQSHLLTSPRNQDQTGTLDTTASTRRFSRALPVSWNAQRPCCTSLRNRLRSSLSLRRTSGSTR